MSTMVNFWKLINSYHKAALNGFGHYQKSVNEEAVYESKIFFFTYFLTGKAILCSRPRILV